MPTLVLMRHAQAESFAASDHERPLTTHGRAQANATGSWLLDQGVVPDLALVSDARRTTETWQALAETTGWQTTVRSERLLYGAEEDVVLDLLRETPTGTQTVLVLGHNPAIGVLVQILDDGAGPGSAVLTGGFPPAAAAVLDVAGDWSELASMGARVRAARIMPG